VLDLLENNNFDEKCGVDLDTVDKKEESNKEESWGKGSKPHNVPAGWTVRFSSTYLHNFHSDSTHLEKLESTNNLT
jgi:hypothetical protein